MSDKTKYQGIVTDRMTGDKKRTKKYDTYFDAHTAAEKLCKRSFSGDRGSIDVETIEN